MDSDLSRNDEVKYLRGFAILAILLGHTAIGISHVSGVNEVVLANVILETFSQFALPLFVVILGFLLTVERSNQIRSNKPISDKRFFIRQFSTIIPIYIIFSLVYILVQTITSSLSGENLPTTGEMAYDMLTAGAYYHLWYFALLIQLILVYPVIIRLFNKISCEKDPVNLLCGALIIQLAWNTALALFGSSLNPVLHDLAGKFFFTHIFYFVLGIHSCLHFEEIRRWFRTNTVWWMLIPTTAITILLSGVWVSGLLHYGSFTEIPETWFISTGFIVPFYYILISAICFRVYLIISEKEGFVFSIVKKLSVSSFGIFLIHPFVMLILNRTIFPRISVTYSDWIYYPLLFISALTISYIIVQFIRYLPYSNMIIGVEPKRERIHLNLWKSTGRIISKLYKK